MSEIVNSSLKTAAKGTAFVLTGTLISNLLWFTAKFLIIRNVTREELGIYSIALAIAGVVALISSLGVQEGATKYISLYLGGGEKKRAHAIANASVQIGLISSLTACFLLFIFSAPIARHLFYMPKLELPLKLIALYIPFYVVSLTMIGILRGYGKVMPKVYFLDIGLPFFFLVALVLCLSFKLSIISMISSYIISTITVFIVIGIYGYKRTGSNFSCSRRDIEYKKLLRFSISMIFLSGMVLVFGWTDMLMLGRYAGAENAGIYSVSLTLANMLTWPYMALSFVFMPIAGEMYARGQLPELKRTYQVITKWLFTATFPVFFILFFFPGMTLVSLFGDGFVDAALSLRMLSSGFMFQAFFGVGIILLMVLGQTRVIWEVSISGTVLNIVLNYMFIKHFNWGMFGASAATMLSYTIVSAINFLVLFRISGIQPFTRSYIKPVAGAGATGIVIYLIAKSLPLYGWMLPIYMLFFMGGYIIFLLFTKSFDKEDVSLLEALFEKLGIEMKWVLRIISKFASS